MHAALIAAVSLPLLFGAPASPSVETTQVFAAPIDAVSIGLDAKDAVASIRSFDGATWTEWQTVSVDTDNGPSLESDMIMLPQNTIEVEVRTHSVRKAIHPIVVSHAPTQYRVAMVRGSTGAPTILSRSEWGADESLRLASVHRGETETTQETAEHQDNGTATYGEPAARVSNCQQDVFNFPDEFHVTKTIKTNADGQKYHWPIQYAPSVKLLVVHHTAMGVSSDTRSPAERVRALYQYHAMTKDWGDIGYNYVIDETGQIYEGRAGGDYVVAGHAYCNNIGSAGIALLGNFENEQPPQAQIQSLQWLLKNLADKYSINLNRSVTFHGKTYSPISGHRDLLDTTCPGFYLYGVLDQIRKNVMAGTVTNTVTYPVKPQPVEQTSTKPFVDQAAARRASRLQTVNNPLREGLHEVGDLVLNGRPGEETLISIRYVAGPSGASRGKVVGTIRRSDDGIGVWVDSKGNFERLKDSLNLQTTLSPAQAETFRMKILYPLSEGTYSLTIGTLTYTLEVSGRRARDRSVQPTEQTYTRPLQTSSRSSSSAPALSSASSRSSVSSASSTLQHTSDIRIRLSYGTTNDSPKTSATVSVLGATTINGASVTGPRIDLAMKGSDCVATSGEKTWKGIVRIDAAESFMLTTWERKANVFRGTLECRVVGGEFVLINELPLDQYLAGLGEEPDTEPYEKQRAFAIAARTYAAFYMDPAHRKFPGKPYDGNDSPALFQKYSGMVFTLGNPNWAKAVRNTSGKVLKVGSEVIKPPYFSSDDGRTRSPDEVGWKNFPFADVFVSKDDHWCAGMPLSGHGVGMSGCGAEAQANAGQTAEQILGYYYPGTVIENR